MAFEPNQVYGQAGSFVTHYSAVRASVVIASITLAFGGFLGKVIAAWIGSGDFDALSACSGMLVLAAGITLDFQFQRLTLGAARVMVLIENWHQKHPPPGDPPPQGAYLKGFWSLHIFLRKRPIAPGATDVPALNTEYADPKVFSRRWSIGAGIVYFCVCAGLLAAHGLKPPAHELLAPNSEVVYQNGASAGDRLVTLEVELTGEARVTVENARGVISSEIVTGSARLERRRVPAGGQLKLEVKTGRCRWRVLD